MKSLWLFPLIGLLGCPPPCHDDDDDDYALLRRITVTGSARLDVAPDEANLSFTFSTTGKKLQPAHQATRKKVDDFVAALSAAGVAKVQVQGSDALVDPAKVVWEKSTAVLELGNIAYSPNMAYPDDRAARIESFTASITVAVKTHDFDLVPVILDAAVDSGLTETSGVRFTASNMPEHKKKVRDLAIQATKEKASQLAEGLGASLGAVQSIQEGTWNLQGLENNVAQSYRRAGGDDESGAIAPGVIPLNLQITAVWALE